MKLDEVLFLTVEDVEDIHALAIERHGGDPSVLNHRAIDGAVMAPRNAYPLTLTEIAAAYGHGITNAHGYVDGNKRTGFSAMDVFLGLNGYRLVFERAKWEEIFLDIARGTFSRDQLAAELARLMPGQDAVWFEEYAEEPGA